ncbi:MAG: hypothetical protein GQ564_11790 [Bacteroidales bacterium]|nr:hypothetical protein [Bacteroidales bacterium]
MKKKSLNSKLVLKKQTITNLNMNEVKGGTGTATCVTEGCPTDGCSNPCIIKTRLTEGIC